MATITMQRDLIVAYKKETLLNVGILSKLQVMPPILAKLMFKENALEKPTQNLFNNLSYYLISIIDSQVSSSLSWPLYDTKMERAYRNEVSSFISDYSSKGLLSPVMSSYLVNPGCFKVTLLMFQLSQLAVQKLLKLRIKEKQTKLYDEMTVKYKLENSDNFIEDIEKETEVILSTFSNYLCKRRAMEGVAEKFHKHITKMEATLASTNAQKLLNDMVDGFMDKKILDVATKNRFQEIKSVNKPAQFFDAWLLETDKKIDEIESKWSEKVSPFLQLCSNTKHLTESLIARQTGEAEKDTYKMEYNHDTDSLCTQDLQNQVNSEQKYILKNIVKDERLNFPNLIRGFLIAIGFILKTNEVSDDIFKFNEYMEGGKKNYGDIVKAMKELLQRVNHAEAKLEPSPLSFHQSISIRHFQEIPPFPDLSDLHCSRGLQCQALFDSFTPLSMSKHQFNLRRKTNLHNFVKPQPRSLLLTGFCKQPQDDLLNTLISCRVSMYDHPNEKYHDQSVISNCNTRVNETIAECSSGFTKQQILRLLSTKKSSSSKKFQCRPERPNINVKKGGLFNDSNTSTESTTLFRSYSSPNLLENKRPRLARRRKLSIMQENPTTSLEVSGIGLLDKDISDVTSFGNSIKLSDTSSLPVISSPQDPDQKFHDFKDFKVNKNEEFLVDNPIKKNLEPTTLTPKNSAQLIRKSSSLEKIINRFRKVRANVIPDAEKTTEFVAISEEKSPHMPSNLTDCNVRVLLPDLLSPNCNVMNESSNNVELCTDLEDNIRRKPRESLGTMLGVDHTFLDQFELID